MSPQFLLACYPFCLPCSSWSWEFWGVLVGHFVQSPSIWAYLIFYDHSRVIGFLDRYHRNEATFLSHYMKILSTWLMTGDVNFNLLTKTMFVRSFYCNITFLFLFPHSSFFKASHRFQLVLRGGWEKLEYLHKLFGILLKGRFIPSLIPIYIVIYVFIPIWIHICLFCTWRYNSVLHYLFFCSNYSHLAIASSFKWALCPFDMVLSFCFMRISLWHHLFCCLSASFICSYYRKSKSMKETFIRVLFSHSRDKV